MKKINILFPLLAIIYLYSCKPSEKDSYKVWSGRDVNEIDYVPVSAVWVKYTGERQFPYKSFDSIDELREIVHYLKEPEQHIEERAFRGKEFLVLYFAPPHQPVRINFSLDEWTKAFKFSRGYSKKLYKIFTQKEQRSRYNMGDYFPGATFEIPVNAVWVIKDSRCKWVPYKNFDSPEELIKIRIRIIEPEVELFTPDFQGEQNLVFFYLPPDDPSWITFSLDDATREVITKRGRSRQLYKLFTEKPPREAF